MDLNHSGGDIILSGVKYLLPNLLSFPFNKPVVVHADSRKQIIRCEFLRQLNPFFGNTYYTTYAITENTIDKKLITNDIVATVHEP